MKELQDKISKKLGFGCMRLPVRGEEMEQIDDELFCKMIDTFLAQGFNYFDTAYPYHKECSEAAIKRCLVERYDREQFLLADKMPIWLVKEPSDLNKVFETQLKRCGVTYFDAYLLHAMNKDRIRDAEEKGAFAFFQQMKQEGKIRHFGFSFHDKADVLDQILTNHPEFEFVQLQINYYDWDSEAVEAGKCYETAVKHKIPVIVMEPVKGGTLANLAEEPASFLKELHADVSLASYAVRYAASLENVIVVLSGMSDLEQMEDNISYMREFCPLSEKEKNAIAKAVEELKRFPTIACTKCRYCVDGCPKQILIPELFESYNMTAQFGESPATTRLYRKAIKDRGTAADCIRCGKCEAQCPQHLEIRKLLEQVSEMFG